MISFHGSIRRAEDFKAGIADHLEDYELFHVSGQQRSGDRAVTMRDFASCDKALITNARCLTEGVNVPTVDLVAFVDPRQSRIDIAQAAGRAMRRPRNYDKQFGYIVVPLFLEQRRGESMERALKRSGFEGVATVIAAMQEQDDDLIDIIRMIRQQEGEGAEGQGQERLNEKIEVLGSELELSVLRNAVQAQVVERLGEDWDYFYGLLLAWKKTSDEEFPRIDEVFRRAELGRWVDRQRSAYKKGLLARGRVEKLESIPGWTWDFTDWLWDRGWRELKSFVEHNSHSLVPDRYVTNNGYKLGAFVKSKRRQYDEGRLPQARALSLEALPRWSWQPNIDQWEIEYEKVRGKAKNSDLLVALEQSGSVHRVWLMTQKSRYSAMTGRSTARHKSLTKDQIKKLEALPGWSWNRRRDSWLAHFVALVAYKDANKGELPPSTNKTLEFRGLRIVSWMIKQRSRVDVREEWQLKMLRKKLPELLESPFEKRWNLAFGKLKEFVRDTGAPYIPQKIRWKGFALGGWVSNQRTKYREKKLTIEQVRLLQSIKGWTWDASALSASGLSKQGVSPLKRARKLR